MGQIRFIVGLVMAALFAVAIISFAIGFANDNSAFVDLSNNSKISSFSTDTDTNMESFTTTVNGSGKAFFENKLIGEDTETAGGQFKTNTLGVVATMSSIITLGFQEIFGQDTNFGIILGAITGLFALMAWLYIWKTWKGNPD